ncbi:hypothetical protein, partial [Actinomadura sp. CNU-125]|uniref:hypothetical protein n=1 Tax=Actinomadura sp. CNU-125 TaxID=1904961 RepID=UPI0021CCF4C8
GRHRRWPGRRRRFRHRGRRFGRLRRRRRNGSAPSGPPPAAVNAFVKCMQGKGIDMPSDIRNWQPPATPSGDMQRAMALCMQVMASAAPR